MNNSIDFLYNLFKEKNFYLLSDCEGSCPCGRLELKGIFFHFHCWRTRHYYNDNSSCQCRYSGLHISFDKNNYNYSQADLKKLGNLCLGQLKERWFNTDWSLVIEDRFET